MKPIILLFPGLLALSVSLQAQLDEWVAPAPTCRLPPAAFEGYLYVPPPVAPARLPSRQMATVDVNFLSAGEIVFGDTCAAWPAEAQAALAYAASIWGSLLSTSNTITIDACWAEGMESGVLGSAGASLYALLSGGSLPTTWYPAALAEILLNNPAQYGTEIRAAFNSERTDWYFGTDGNVPMSEIDFVTVALHELGHGLGFAGIKNIDDGISDDDNPIECNGVAGAGCYGAANAGTWYPDIFSRQVKDASNTALTGIGNPSVTVAGLLTSGEGASGELFLGSASVLAGNSGLPAVLYTPSTYKHGSTYSHFDLSTFGSELMKPQLNYGQAIHNPGLALNLLEDLGWGIDFSALPVTWLYFGVREEKEALVLDWETGTEENNAGFEVQRSRDGTHWEALAFVPGKGEGAAYTYQDQHPYAGLSYYRLQQVDFDGQSAFSKTEAAYFSGGKAEDIGFFPNPAKEELTVAHAGFSGPVPFIVTDMLGQAQVRGLLQSPREKVSLRGLPAGMYWLRVGQEAPLSFMKI